MTKNIHSNYRFTVKAGILSLFVLIGVFQAGAQVRVGFQPRTSQQAPGDYKGVQNYYLQGDFTMIGNTNITLRSYTDGGSNGNVQMDYVDIDGDVNTLNSSSAQLVIPDAACSEIIYAGLYWTGRAHDATTSAHTFNVTKTIIAPGAAINLNNQQASYDNALSSYTGYTFNQVSRQQEGTSINRTYYPRYGIEGTGLTTYYFRITNDTNNRVQVSTSTSGPWTTLPSSYNTSTGMATLNTPHQITIDNVVLSITGFVRNPATDGNANSYQNAARIIYNVSGNQNISQSVTKNFDKKKVQLKKEGENYQEITALSDAIYYPSGNPNPDGVMYSAYADITNYVRQHGVGNYFVADIALREGNGGGTGYYGGWGMVVIYKNPAMKWRDITVFDGHAYVAGSTTVNHELSVSGFRAAQNGDVNVTMGMMAGEGDVGISGDYFEITNAANNNWVRLNHSGNTTGNFFNSSINTGGNLRNPTLANNTGLDIARFDLSNTNNVLIANNATSTRFRYGSTQDTYVIFNIVLAVDAYVPLVIGENSPGTTTPTSGRTVDPGQELDFHLDIYNKGEEAVNNTKIEIPIPYNLHYVPDPVAVQGTHQSIKISNNTTAYWVPPAYAPSGASPADYAGGTLVWEIGHLPYDVSKEILQGTLNYKFKVTDNCALLTTVGPCGLSININGTVSGVGATSTTAVSAPLVKGGTSSTCGGNDFDDYESTIEVSAEFKTQCAPPPVVDGALQFVADCSLPNNVFPRADIADHYPLGTKFFTSEPTSYDQTTNVLTGDFPVNPNNTKTTYWAVVPGMAPGCHIMLQTVLEPCKTNYWMGGTTGKENDWDEKDNWTGNRVPDEGEDIEFATAVNNNGNPAIADLYLDNVNQNNTGGRVIGDLTNNSNMNLVITTGNQLIIQGEVKPKADASSTGTIVVKADPNNAVPNGTLILNPAIPSNLSVQAEVEFYNGAYECDDCGFYRNSWQYFGIPVQTSTIIPPFTGNQTVNKWTEPANGNKWIGATVPLEAFAGYEVTRKDNAEPTAANAIHTFKGTLNVFNNTHTIPLSYTGTVNYRGMNLVGNSFTAAIPINQTALKFSGNVDNTVYLFNTGTRDEWRKLNGAVTAGVASGSYISVPIHVAGMEQLPIMIPSTHAFMVQVHETATLTLDYSTLVKNQTVAGPNGQVATRSASGSTSTAAPAGTTAAVQQLPSLRMDVMGEQSADRVWIFAKEGTTRGFDNGWDSHKMAESGIAQLYVMDDTGKEQFQVATVPGLDNVTLGFTADADGKYTIDFALSDHWTSQEIYLQDLSTGTRTRVTKNGSYTFSAKKGDSTARFRLSSSGDIPITDEAAMITVNTTADGHIAIVNNGSSDCTVFVSNTAGTLLQKLEVKAGSEQVVENPGTGSYVVRLQNAVINDVRRVVVR